MQLNQIVNDRQAEPEPSVDGRRAVRLAEPIEHVRQECGIDADARVLTSIRMRSLTCSTLTMMRPPLGVNLTALDNRFHKTCCRRVASARTLTSCVPRRVNREILGFRRRPHARQRRLEHRHDRQRFEVDLQLAGRHARHVDEIVHELRLRLRVSIDQFESALSCLFAEMIVEQHSSSPGSR